MRVLWSWVSPSSFLNLSDCHHLNACADAGPAERTATARTTAMRAARRPNVLTGFMVDSPDNTIRGPVLFTDDSGKEGIFRRWTPVFSATVGQLVQSADGCAHEDIRGRCARCQ